MKIAGLGRALSRFGVALGCALVLIVAPARAQTQVELPPYRGYVNDFANVLSPDASARLEDLARRVNAATKGDMVIVTLPDIAGRAPSDVALNIGRQWKVGANAEIGDKARNAGVIILLVPKETSSTNRGSCFIATGQGSEGFITDATSGSICREATNYFRVQDYSSGLQLIADRVSDLYAREFNVSISANPAAPRPSTAPQRSSRGREGSGIVGIIVLFIFISILRGRGRRGGNAVLDALPFIVAAASQSRGRNDHWGGGGGGFGGGGGGGFGGFGGGGGFSGGGGGSDW